MWRRRYLSLCAVTASGAIAGCSSGADSNATPRDAVYENALRDRLTDSGITVRRLSNTNGTVNLEYVPAEPTEASVETSIDTTATEFFNRVDGGWGVDVLEARIYIDGSLVATWQMERTWIEAYLDGDISRDELGEKVRASVERHDGGTDEDADADDHNETSTGTASETPAKP